MIVEDEGDAITNLDDDDKDTMILVNQAPVQGFQHYLQRSTELRDGEVHHQLRSDLVEHIWNGSEAMTMIISIYYIIVSALICLKFMLSF
ncbi:conserved hypothetical protein [Ricinus communis]|uniref:Uncharacterized protein n=1 Tax=Ricinus communis TaxID=3988 RepID=B9T1D6_RICCO|nr:conserved hypothetical protein [Ricinus communis]